MEVCWNLVEGARALSHLLRRCLGESKSPDAWSGPKYSMNDLARKLENGRDVSLTEQGSGIAMKVGFIGLGRMGTGMAANLLKAGHTVTVYNRSPGKAGALISEGAKEAL